MNVGWRLHSFQALCMLLVHYQCPLRKLVAHEDIMVVLIPKNKIYVFDGLRRTKTILYQSLLLRTCVSVDPCENDCASNPPLGHPQAEVIASHLALKNSTELILLI